MILALRQRHRRIVFSLGVLLPAVFVIGIAARRPVPVVSSLPAALAPEPSHIDRVVWDRADLWPRTGIRTRLLASPGDGESFAVELSAAKEIVQPDLLVYWIPGNPKIASALPGGAVLLGAFVQAKPVALPLPGEAAAGDGVLLLYSLADHEVVATSNPFAVR
jgi:hypothetical protein